MRVFEEGDQMRRRRLGGLEVSAIGLGCATMTPFYDEPDENSIDTVRRAREIGVDLLDSSDAYGQGRNEELIAPALRGHRDEYVIARPRTARRRRTAGRNSSRRAVSAA
jgi:aryl-alcohol dehydrogenase-like predicted oxidoreductase